MGRGRRGQAWAAVWGAGSLWVSKAVDAAQKIEVFGSHLAVVSPRGRSPALEWFLMTAFLWCLAPGQQLQYYPASGELRDHHLVSHPESPRVAVSFCSLTSFEFKLSPLQHVPFPFKVCILKVILILWYTVEVIVRYHEHSSQINYTSRASSWLQCSGAS